MAKLHELLAVEADAEGTYKKILEEATNTFAKKGEHFFGRHRTLEMFDESRRNEDSEEHHEMVTTVLDKLDYIKDSVVRYYDIVLQKEVTNQIAKADLIVDGVTLAYQVPATFLLGMESKLKTLRGVFEAIPTLAPGIKWEIATEAGRGVYKAAYPDIKLRTAKTFMHKVLVPPTDKHPAQIEKWEEQVPVGKYTTTTQCSMLSPGEKSVLIGKVDKLIQACKQARQRANSTEVTQIDIGKMLFDYIMG